MICKIIDRKDADISEIIADLKKGIVGIIPTDACYALVGNANSETVVKEIYRLKNKKPEKNLSVVLPIELIPEYADIPADLGKKLSQLYQLPIGISAKPKQGRLTALQYGDRIKFFSPNDNFVQEILTNIDFPIASSLANITGEATTLDKDRITKLFSDKVAFIVLAESFPYKESETILEVEGDEVRVKKWGSVGEEQLKKILPDIIILGDEEHQKVIA